jgi:hypothetical protein
MIFSKLPQLVGPASLSVIRLTGLATYSENAATLRAVYVGNGSNLVFLRDLFFGEAAAEILESGVHPFRLHSVLARLRSSVDLLLSELPPLWAAALPGAGLIRIPAWMRQVLWIPSSKSAAKAETFLPRSVEKEVGRHIRRQQYVMDFTVAPQDMRLFFHQYYRPYVQSRFGNGACLAEEQAFMQRCQEQVLARLHAGDRWVAGMLIKRQRESMRFGWFGSIVDPPLPGSSEVLDTLLIRHARQSGVKRIVMGDSRPCLADGVVRYKAKFGATITRTTFPQPTLYIDAPRWSEAICETLTRSPLVTVKGSKPYVYRVHRSHQNAAVHLEALHQSRPRDSDRLFDEHHSGTH